MSSKVSSRARKQREKNEMKQDIVAQVHKSVKRDQSEERENNLEDTESKKTFIIEDKNDNYSLRTPSRDVSVDGESQINSKILNLIETEMRRDINKISHFTDSRPQSLSFYEEEKIPEELSGNLELLSPEERKHYKRRKEYVDLDLERNAYNNLQDSLCRENEEGGKKSKRKKKHSGDAELGLGDSREMMIPKEKRKSKKKKREYSPLSSASGKRKHKKRDEDYEPKSEITLALEELQDDVFENAPDEFIKTERTKRSPRKSDKLYVQRKNRFEAISRNEQSTCRLTVPNEEGRERSVFESHPIHLATLVQKYWIRITLVCQGLLGGLALGHYLYFHKNKWVYDEHFINFYSNFVEVFMSIFFVLCIVSIIAIFDRYDVSHISFAKCSQLLAMQKRFFIIAVFLVLYLLHLISAAVDDKIALIPYNLNNTSNTSNTNITLAEWNHFCDLSFWKTLFAVSGWILVPLTMSEDLFYNHLKTMEKYAIWD